MKSINKKISIQLVTCGLLLVFIIGTFIIFSPSPALGEPIKGIEIQDAVYKVDAQGNLTIQLLGTVQSLSIIEDNFSLNFIDDYEIPTFSNGKPLIELQNNGSAFHLDQNEDFVNLTFSLQTHNTTTLPKSYRFQVDSINKTINPRWLTRNSPDQENIGMGAGINVFAEPYITSFYAYDSTKGNTLHVKTYIYNQESSVTFDARELKYELNSTPYMYDWEDWTPEYSESTTIPSEQTLVVHDYLEPMFTGPNGRYALNAGDPKSSSGYTITRVYAEDYVTPETDLRWSDYYSPTVTEGEFAVTNSGTNTIFTAVYYDTEFTSLSWMSGVSVNTYFEDAVSHKMKVWDDENATTVTADDGLEELMSVDYYPYIISGWNPSSGYNCSEMLNHLYQTHAETDLGLSGDWKRDGDGNSLTANSNHGFDLVVGLTGVSSHSGGGTWDVPGNHAIVCGKDFNLKKAWELVLVHELSHTFGAEDPPNPTPPCWCVMQGGKLNSEYISDDWFVHYEGNVDDMTGDFRYSPPDTPYIKSESRIYHIAYQVYSEMKIQIRHEGLYSARVEYRVKPDGGSYGNWITDKWYNQTFTATLHTKTDFLYSGSEKDTVDVRWTIYPYLGDISISTRTESYVLPVS